MAASRTTLECAHTLCSWRVDDWHDLTMLNTAFVWQRKAIWVTTAMQRGRGYHNVL